MLSGPVSCLLKSTSSNIIKDKMSFAHRWMIDDEEKKTNCDLLHLAELI